MAEEQTLSLMAYSWLILLAIQFVGATYILGLIPLKVFDGGWAWGRIVWWLVTGLIIWNLGYLGIAAQSQRGVEIVCLVSALGALAVGYLRRRTIRRKLREGWRWWLLEEGLFLGGFAALVWIRAYKPDILDLEKFMDFGFMQAYLRTAGLPAADMWYAGSTINYYSFGHFMGAMMARVWHIDLVYAYNLLLGLILGLGLVQTLAVAVMMLEPVVKSGRAKLIGGLTAAALVNIGGNSHTIWYWLSNGSFDKYWYADATRFIHNTIHEFPSYSFVVSDLHGHVWGLPIVLLYMGVVWGWTRAERVKETVAWAGVMGGLIGVMAMTNTWDAMVYGMLTAIAGTWRLMAARERFGEELVKMGVAAMTAALAAVATAFFWLKGFESIAEGVRLVTQRSPIHELAILWMGHVVLTAGAVALGIFARRKKETILVFCLAVAAVALLILPEVIYFKDIYPNHPRANTMFKLTYQAFIMMGILGGWAAGAVDILKARRVKVLAGLAIAITTAALLPFPYFAYNNYYGNFDNFSGLDGSNWLYKQYPDDYELIRFMKQSVKQPGAIVEAVGESYTTFGRVSVFTGMPTILGWRVHEWLWRGSFDGPAKRTEEVRTIYERPQSAEATNILRNYGVGYIVLGDKEREAYTVNEKGVEKLGEVIFRQGNSRLVKIN